MTRPKPNSQLLQNAEDLGDSREFRRSQDFNDSVLQGEKCVTESHVSFLGRTPDIEGDEDAVPDNEELEYFEQRNIHVLKNGNSHDEKLDKDVIDNTLCVENISEMIKAKLPIVQFMES